MIRITNPIVMVVVDIAIVSMYFGLPDRKNPIHKEEGRLVAVLDSVLREGLTEPETKGAKTIASNTDA